jgi:DNA helicase HerA-like ATPase/ribosomal protein S25
MPDQRREEGRRRLGPSIDQGTSRVSSAAGRMSSASGQHARINLETSGSSVRQSTRSRASAQQSQKGRTGSRTRKSSSATPAPRSTTRTSTNSPDPKDTQFINWLRHKWRTMAPHQKQSFFSTLLLLLGFLLFSALTTFRDQPVLGGVNKFFQTFLGWSAYPFVLGLIAFALLRLIEGVRRQRIIRGSMVVGLVVILLLLLIESRLIMGHLSAGVLAEFLVIPLLGWPPAAEHVLVIGLLLVVIALTFRLNFGHVLVAARFLKRLIGDVPGVGTAGVAAQQQAQTSRFPGQRPQYSRYSGVRNPTVADTQAMTTGRSRRRFIAEEDEFDAAMVEDDDGTIEFEPDFDDDPQNDINLHKHEITAVRRGARAPQPLDLDEHKEAVRGASQQELPFDEAVEAPQRLVLQESSEMEALPPNPKKASNRVRGNIPAAPAAQAMPVITSPWKVADTSLLHSPEELKLQKIGADTTELAHLIQETLRSFRVDAEVREEDISIGPTVIRFGIRPTGKPELRQDEKTGKMVPVRDGSGNIIYETRTRVSRIMALQNDLALVLEAKTIRMEAPVPGRPYVGVEIPNKNGRLVTLREILESKEYEAARRKSRLALALGRDVAGQVRVGDLAKMPHVLIAGATGAGKSVMINTIIASFLTQATPDDVRMLMVDPKMVELSMYNGIPHLLSPVVTEVDKVVPLLKNAISEMERRYRLFSQLGVRNLDGYRKMRLEKIAKGDNSLNNLPSIVIIIDELADLMMAAPEEVEGMICRLAQLARATGIHLVIATQRPSVDVITGLIKANIPTRISFMVSSAVDSRTIIDMGGAERLLGRGDMLYLPADAGRPERIQAAFLADEEAQALVDFWQQQVIEYNAATIKDTDNSDVATYPAVEPGWEIKEEAEDEFELNDDLLDKAEEVVHEYGKASISLLQRRLRIGYSRAARLIDLLEEHGIIGQDAGGGRGREVLDGSRRNGGYGHYSNEDEHSLASEAEDIVEEERQRNEFLRQQAAMRPRQSQRRQPHEADDQGA